MVRGYPEYKKHIQAFFDNGIAPCPDCGAELPAGDDAMRQTHFATCPGKHADSDSLTSVESDELQACEQIIERGVKIWQEVGEALLHIRDKRLYRARYKTFEDYCRGRWQLSERRSYQLLEAANVLIGLKNFSAQPEYENQARELTTLAPDEQQIVWQVVLDTAPDGKVTAAHVKSVVNVLKEVTRTGAIDDGSGEQIPVSEATTEHLKAALTEETYERMLRQREHISANSKRKTKLLHNVEFDAMTEFDLANLSLTMKRQMVGKHIQIVIKEIGE